MNKVVKGIYVASKITASTAIAAVVGGKAYKMTDDTAITVFSAIGASTALNTVIGCAEAAVQYTQLMHQLKKEVKHAEVDISSVNVE